MKTDWLQALKAKDFRALTYFMERGMLPEAPRSRWERNILGESYSSCLISWALSNSRFDLANKLFEYGVPLPEMTHCAQDNNDSERDYCLKLIAHPTDMFIALKQNPSLVDNLLHVLEKYSDKIKSRMSKRQGFFQQYEVNYQLVSQRVMEMRQAQRVLEDQFVSMCDRQELTAYDYMSLPPTDLQIRHSELDCQITDMETKLKSEFLAIKSDHDKDTDKLRRVDDLQVFVQKISLS